MTTPQKHLVVAVLILLVATWLRLHLITEIPPGLTHDEADHGLDAWGVVNGIRPTYFTVGYGREPFYDYATAVLMAFLGPTYLAGRLTSVFFSLFFLAGSYAWVRRAFDGRVALLTMAGLAVGFWPLMVARHALRTITLPALLVLAAAFFWEGMRRPAYRFFLVAGVLLGLTFYTYIPARALWLIFPAALLYLAWRDRPAAQQRWRGVALMMGLALLVAAPLLIYLYTHPQAEVRLEQLAGPLLAAREGDFAPLLANVAAGLRILALEGDSAWRYNIAGRPLLVWPLALLFVAGVVLAVVRMVRPGRFPAYRGLACFFALLWLAVGWLPVLITGPELSTTQAIGMQPVIYLFPALALVAAGEWLFQGRLGLPWRRGLVLVPLLLFGWLGVDTVRAYFDVWANHPEVKLQYGDRLVAMMDYLNEQGRGSVAISSPTPGRFHDPAAAQMLLTNDRVDLRWFDGRASLLLPQDAPATLIFSDQATLHPALAVYLGDAGPAGMLPGSNFPLAFYSVDGSALLPTLYPQFQQVIHNSSTDIHYGEALSLLGYDLQTPQAVPGDVVRLATLWRVERPVMEDVVLFTHLVGPADPLVAQVDRLDVPADFWHPGDVFVQLHELVVPPELAAGEYTLAVGVYTRPDIRWPLVVDGQAAGDILPLATLVVGP